MALDAVWRALRKGGSNCDYEENPKGDDRGKRQEFYNKGTKGKYDFYKGNGKCKGTYYKGVYNK